jgi:hypothetical protein
MRRAFWLAILALAGGLAGCATAERLSAANDVHALLVSIRDDDRQTFEAHVDRPALEAQIQSRLAAHAPKAEGDLAAAETWLEARIARAAGGLLIQPRVFAAVADYYGYSRETPIPNVLELAAILRPLPGERVCATQKRRGPCLLTFAHKDGAWRLVSFDGDVNLLRPKARSAAP